MKLMFNIFSLEDAVQKRREAETQTILLLRKIFMMQLNIWLIIV